MSMYCEVLCIRLPIDDDVIQIMKSKLIELGVINSDDLVDRRDIIDQYIEIIYEKSDDEHFRKVGCSYSDRYYGYLDYVLKAEHDSDDGEFGRVRELYPEEIVCIANMRIYQKLLFKYPHLNLR